MEFKSTKFKDAWIIQPKVFKDGRGFFLESFANKWFEEKDIKVNFIQDNHSKSVEVGVLRGFHFQLPPYTQTKLVRVTKGKVYDVIVDLRQDSEIYGQWQGFELSEKNFTMLLIPKGFAHAFCTLEPDTEFQYKVDQYYEPKSEDGIIWNDPTLNIDWPIKEPILSEKDSKLQTFEEFKSPFRI